MAHKVVITSKALIDALEHSMGNVYESIEEEDVVTDVRLLYRGKVEITIGKEED